jgi:hypothetical protein
MFLQLSKTMPCRLCAAVYIVMPSAHDIKAHHSRAAGTM